MKTEYVALIGLALILIYISKKASDKMNRAEVTDFIELGAGTKLYTGGNSNLDRRLKNKQNFFNIDNQYKKGTKPQRGQIKRAYKLADPKEINNALQTF